nr:retrovirus-related Pol polyprotein from transposon TNT 1-94 [Tanacetum cinerariifolium]
MFLKRITILFQSPVIIIRTDNGTEFKNQILKEYFDTVGISHQMSSIRTPQQNEVVERRNRSLVEAARTMLIFSRAPLFLWAEAIASACFTQNRSIIHRRFNKTPYDLINGRKPDILFLRVFGALCYPKNDPEDIEKLGAKGDIGFFFGYSAVSCAYRIYNRRTKKIMETMNVLFDELSAMAFKQSSSKPRLNSMTSRHISSGLDLTYAPSTITTQQPSEGELDLLFEAMYDDYIGGQPSATARTVPPAQEPQDVDELNPNAMVDGNTFVNPFANSSISAAASSSQQNVDPSNMHTFYQPYPHEFQWTKDHPLEQVIGEPSQPVLTRNQLRYDGDMCMYALSVSTMVPKNVKEAMTDPAWIDSMQEELLQFKRLDVWVLVPAPENISPLTLKWLFKNKHDEEQTAKPTKKHLKEVKRIFRYLLGTINTGLCYTKNYGFELTGFSYADYAGCKDTFKSTSGGAQFLGEKLVSWSSKKQDYTAMSIAEAEYVSLSTCCTQVLWMRTQLTDYGFHFNKILIYCDSKSTIAISYNPVQHSRTKNIAVHYYFIKEHVEKGTIELYFVKMDYQLADIFTKSLLTDRFNYMVRRLGMPSLSPKDLERLEKSQHSVGNKMHKAFPLPGIEFPLAEEVPTASEEVPASTASATIIDTTSGETGKKSGRTVTVARELLAAILKTFGGNEATKKTKKNLLKQQSDLDTMSLDDLYNHLKICESEVKNQSEPNSQNMAFISSAKHISGNEDGNTACVPTVSTNVPIASASVATISQDTACAYIASQSSEKKISIQGSDVAGFDKLKVECFNCHKMGLKLKNRGRRDTYRQGSKVEEQAPKVLMAIDGVGWDWSYMENDEEDHALVADEEAPTKFTLMANTSPEIKKLEILKKEKEGVDGKLADFLTASKDLDNLIESQRADKNKDGLGYSVVPPPPAQIYSSPNKDLSWTGLLEFADDTVTDYSRPSPTMESTSSDDQNQNPSVSESEASPSAITPKPFIKFVKASDSPTKSKIDKAEKAKKSPVKYVEQYKKTNKKPNKKGENGTSRYQDNTHKSFTPRPVAHRPYRSLVRPGSSQNNIDDKFYWDSGCSRHMTGNISYLSDYEPFDGGYMSFGQGGCKITGKGTIKTGKLEFENVYFMKDLKYNLFSVS